MCHLTPNDAKKIINNIHDKGVFAFIPQPKTALISSARGDKQMINIVIVD